MSDINGAWLCQILMGLGVRQIVVVLGVCQLLMGHDIFQILMEPGVLNKGF